MKLRFLIIPALLLGQVQAQESMIHQAVREENSLKLLEEILGNLNTSVDRPNRYGVRPLAIACEKGNLELVEILLENKADPNAAQAGNETPLMTAARTGKVEIVKRLVAAGARINEKEHHQQTALMWAAAEGHVEVVRFLLEKGAEFQKPLDSGFTPLLFAVRQGHLEVAKLLIEKGADVTEASVPKGGGPKWISSGTAPLIHAVENGHFDVAAMLLEKGADPNDQRSGYSPLHVLSWVRKSVKGDGDDGLPIPRGSGEMTSLEFVKTLVKDGADPNLRLKGGGGGTARVDRKGATPFLMAAETADLDFLKTLIDVGADATIANQTGTTPLLAAAGMGVTAPGEEAGSVEEAMEVVRFLIELGAHINGKDGREETVMHAAAYKSAPMMIRLLDELGADISIWNQKNKSGWTPLLITQGFRPGNFRPIATTEAVLAEVMKKHGVETPPAPEREKKIGYE
ncbi:MAG: ankyrin repeat domain-containing protein [Akkermansiaceae bacterium]|jgi:ankyrin repeat protein